MQTDNPNTKQIKSNAEGLLYRHGVRHSTIARRCGKSHDTVTKALGLDTCGGVTLRNLSTVRTAAEDLLLEAGYSGDMSELWAEYDEQFKRAA